MADLPKNDSIIFMNLNSHHNHEERSTCMKRILHVSDTFLSLFVISPLVVSHWRGTWGYMDQKQEYFPAWHCFLLGSVLHTMFAILREPLQAEFSKPSNGVKNRWRTVLRFVVTKVYTYVFSISCIMHWRGGWEVMKMYLDYDLWPALTVSAICFIPLVLMKSVRNLLAPPFVILTDHKESVFSFPTRFRIETVQCTRCTYGRDATGCWDKSIILAYPSSNTNKEAAIG